MSIMYEVYRRVESSSCYGGINSILEDYGVEDFTGITLYMFKENRDYDYEGLICDKKDDDYVKTMMRMARAVGFGEYIPRTLNDLKAAGEIHFPPDVPFWIVVAVTGFFRAWANNHTTLHKVYDMLISKGLDPITAFCGAQSMTEVKDKYYFKPNGEHSIVPWTIFNKEGVEKFRTWRDRRGELMSMVEEITKDGRLDYEGRDVWFGAKRSGNNWFDWDKSQVGHCVTLKHLINKTYDKYDSNPINIDSLVEEVKSWTS